MPYPDGPKHSRRKPESVEFVQALLNSCWLVEEPIPSRAQKQAAQAPRGSKCRVLVDCHVASLSALIIIALAVAGRVFVVRKKLSSLSWLDEDFVSWRPRKHACCVLCLAFDVLIWRQLFFLFFYTKCDTEQSCMLCLGSVLPNSLFLRNNRSVLYLGYCVRSSDSAERGDVAGAVLFVFLR